MSSIDRYSTVRKELEAFTHHPLMLKRGLIGTSLRNRHGPAVYGDGAVFVPSASARAPGPAAFRPHGRPRRERRHKLRGYWARPSSHLHRRPLNVRRWIRTTSGLLAPCAAELADTGRAGCADPHSPADALSCPCNTTGFPQTVRAAPRNADMRAAGGHRTGTRERPAISSFQGDEERFVLVPLTQPAGPRGSPGISSNGVSASRGSVSRHGQRKPNRV